MGLKKGQTNNPNGRPKGTNNSWTREIRQVIGEMTSTEDLVQKLLILTEHDDPKVVIAALRVLIEYKHGMPQRKMDLDITDQRSHKDIIAELDPPK
jgi:hypothetical protein